MRNACQKGAIPPIIAVEEILVRGYRRLHLQSNCNTHGVRRLGGLMLFSRLSWPIVVLTVMVVALLGLGSVKFVRDGYPIDPFQSKALAKCVAGDPGFVRFFPDERARCYARQPRQTRLEAASEMRQN
jgi:hypothetical protein